MAGALGLILGVASGCFNGADALGLPCNDDQDCGRDQACEAGFCGGAPASTGGNESGSETGTTLAPGSSSGSEGSSTSQAGRCGDGIVDEGEACDPGPEASAECDADCTAVECGDMTVNVAAGEACDPPEAGTCTAACDAVLFFDDMSDAAVSEAELWRTMLPDIGGRQLDASADWGVVGNVWRTGAYSCRPGIADLITAGFPLDETPPDHHLELSFRHRFNFDPNEAAECAGIPPADGGVVHLIADGQPFKVEGIYPGASLLMAGECPAPAQNPLPPGPAFTEAPAEQGFVTVVASLEIPDAAGAQTGEIRFTVGYDCNNCGHECDMGSPGSPPPPEYGWEIDDVRVEVVPNG